MKKKINSCSTIDAALKFDLKMKLTILFAFICLFQSMANNSYSQTAKLSLDMEQVSLNDVIRKIESISEFKFLFNRKDVNLDRIVSVKVKNKKITKILSGILSESNLEFEVLNKQIVLRHKIKKPVEIIPKEVVTAQQSVSGKITDEQGMPLSGANIIEKDTNNGVTSDFEGSFSINVANNNAVLVVSYIGFADKEVVVGDQTSFVIALSEDTTSLNEVVVVVGYGTTKKTDLTGAISSISSQAISELPIASPQDAIQGRISGVDVVSTGNTPGSNPTIRIRGRRSFAAGNDPLFVVDGIPFAGGLNDINSSDIESMDVLKDASATAIYGSRGANGVILITTKRGRNSEKATISYDGYYGHSSVISRIPVGDGEYFAELQREAERAAGSYDDNNPNADAITFSTTELESIATGRYTDWQDLLLQTGTQLSHQIGVSGGSENTKYLVSANYFNEEGVVRDIYDFERYSLRVNLDKKLSNRIKIGVSMSVTGSTQNGAGYSNAVAPFTNGVVLNPLYSPFDEDGNIINQPDPDESLLRNPLLDFVPGAVIKENKRFRVFTSFYADVDLGRGFSYRLNYGPDFQYSRRGEYTASASTELRDGINEAGYNNGSTFAYTLENILNYNKTFGEHSLNFTGLYSFQRQTTESYSSEVSGIPIPEMTFRDVGSASTILGVNSGYNQWSIESYMARVNYNYASKYYLTLTARRDGSSRFAPGKKYGTFPSVGAGWTISNEDFLADSSTVSFLKLRSSYGEIGNTGINPYKTLGSISRTNYTFGDNGIFGYRGGETPNPDLTWETTASFNIGLDYGLFNNRISGTVNWYKQSTSDLLLDRLLPPDQGTANVVLQNVGKTENKGLEIDLSTVNVTTDNFTWTTDLNFFTNTEAIVDLYGDQTDDVGNGWFIGQPLTVYYDYQKIGIWQLDEATEAVTFGAVPGEVKLADLAGRDADGNATAGPDGQITAEDRVIIGSDLADWTAGITNRFEYKNIDFSFFVYIKQGGLVSGPFGSGNGRRNTLVSDYWTPNNPTNAFPRPNANGAALGNSAASYFDASYVQVRNIQLGYRLPEEIISRLNITSLRVYLSGQNLFTFSDYSDLHGVPPIGIGNAPAGGAESRASAAIGAIPPTKLITLGVNVKF